MMEFQPCFLFLALMLISFLSIFFFCFIKAITQKLRESISIFTCHQPAHSVFTWGRLGRVLKSKPAWTPTYSEQQRAARHNEVSELRRRQPGSWMQIVSRASRCEPNAGVCPCARGLKFLYQYRHILFLWLFLVCALTLSKLHREELGAGSWMRGRFGRNLLNPIRH